MKRYGMDLGHTWPPDRRLESLKHENEKRSVKSTKVERVAIVAYGLPRGIKYLV